MKRYMMVNDQGRIVRTKEHIKGPPLKFVPPDVQEIVDYTKLRKRYPRKDRILRKKHGIPLEGSITMEQMRLLLKRLKKKKVRVCE